MNIYITGLNQVSDVEIDKINKPYLPIASGELSYMSAVVVVFASLAVAYASSINAALPLKATLVGSFILGTLYSLPPFRLKRYPLLAAFCILVVRGSLINLGFIMQAKTSVFNTALTVNEFLRPESIAVTLFFAIFGVVIALLKDVPDIKGDKEFKIPSFSVKKGATKIFKLSWTLLLGLLWGSSLVSVAGFTALSPSLNTPKRVSRALFSILLAVFGFDVQKRARVVVPSDSKIVFEFYMYVWNIFYACYLILPLIGA